MVTVPILFGREKCNGFLGIEKFLGRGEYPAEARPAVGATHIDGVLVHANGFPELLARPRVFRLDGGSLHFCIPR